MKRFLIAALCLGLTACSSVTVEEPEEGISSEVDVSNDSSAESNIQTYPSDDVRAGLDYTGTYAPKYLCPMVGDPTGEMELVFYSSEEIHKSSAGVNFFECQARVYGKSATPEQRKIIDGWGGRLAR